MSGLLRYTWCGDGRWQFGTLAVDGWAVTFGSRRTGALYRNTMIGTLAVDGWVVTFGTARGVKR